MKQVLKYTGYILAVVILGFLIWKFYYILFWIIGAAILSFVGQPLVRFFDRIHIRKLGMPHTMSTILTLAVIVIFFLGLIAVFVPLIINQAETISKIDVSTLEESLMPPLQRLDGKLHHLGVIPEGETLQEFAVNKLKSLVSVGNISGFLGGVIRSAGNFFVGLFSILFITFFFLKDENLFEAVLLLVVPEKNHEAAHKVVEESKHLLGRYFIGVFLEVLGVMSLIAIGLWIFGIRNALLIGFFGGIMNIIPYLGPIIGSVIGISLGITGTLASGSLNDVWPALLKLTGVFLTVNFIDNNILVPMIYSKSVKSHPLEIFLVIIIGGGIAGLAGMLLAVPVYTLLRVIAREFFQQFRLVKKLTETID